jgi:Uncharacterized protein conserved in bacteria
MKVIVNADDLGRNSIVNEAILRLIDLGVVTSSTVMANGMAYDDAINIVLSHPEISCGVHLCLDEFSSLLQSSVFEERGITNNHYFLKGKIAEVNIDDIIEDEILNELSAQVQKIGMSGISISHFDSHHHCHTLPNLQNIIVRLLDTFAIEKVRLKCLKTFDMYLHRVRQTNVQSNIKDAGIVKKRNIIKSIRSYHNDLSWNHYMKNHYVTTDFFCSFLFFYQNLDYMQNHFDNKTIELMCHPGHPDYEQESCLLEKFDFKREGCDLISYHSLHKG